MIALGPDQCATLVKAAALHRAAPDVLTGEEHFLIEDLVCRCLKKDFSAQATEAEWCSVGAIVLKLQDALRERGIAHYLADGRTRVVIGSAAAPVVLGEVRA